MKILVTNDDGIHARGLRVLVEELVKVGEVMVAAPDREQSAAGTSITIHQPLIANPIAPLVNGVKAYSIEGTPADCVILALEALFPGKVDVVISGINQGLNVGSDVLVSGTVGAALQGYLRGFPSVAISVEIGEEAQFYAAAKLGVVLACQIAAGALPRDIFLNVNLPDLPIEKMGGVEITRLARRGYVDKIEEEYDGNGKYYRFVRGKPERNISKGTDVWALAKGNISVTPLQSDLTSSGQLPILERLCPLFLQELRLGNE